MVVLSYAARYSAYNNIEHLWSPVSKKLNIVILPSILEGDEQEPHKQTDLSKDEKRAKEALVFKIFLNINASVHDSFLWNFHILKYILSFETFHHLNTQIRFSSSKKISLNFKVFDNAMEHIVKNYWLGMTFNDSTVQTSFKPCMDRETPYDDYDTTVHKVIKSFFYSSRSKSN